MLQQEHKTPDDLKNVVPDCFLEVKQGETILSWSPIFRIDQPDSYYFPVTKERMAKEITDPASVLTGLMPLAITACIKQPKMVHDVLDAINKDWNQASHSLAMIGSCLFDEKDGKSNYTYDNSKHLYEGGYNSEDNVMVIQTLGSIELSDVMIQNIVSTLMCATKNIGAWIDDGINTPVEVKYIPYDEAPSEYVSNYRRPRICSLCDKKKKGMQEFRIHNTSAFICLGCRDIIRNGSDIQKDKLMINSLTLDSMKDAEYDMGRKLTKKEKRDYKNRMYSDMKSKGILPSQSIMKEASGK